MHSLRTKMYQTTEISTKQQYSLVLKNAVWYFLQFGVYQNASLVLFAVWYIPNSHFCIHQTASLICFAFWYIPNRRTKLFGIYQSGSLVYVVWYIVNQTFAFLVKNMTKSHTIWKKISWDLDIPIQFGEQ